MNYVCFVDTLLHPTGQNLIYYRLSFGDSFSLSLCLATRVPFCWTRGQLYATLGKSTLYENGALTSDLLSVQTVSSTYSQ